MIDNPYRPGAGHSPPFLAGRAEELRQFKRLLQQKEVTQNIVLTGLRGVGKTVLMDDAYRPLALNEGWIWVGTNLSESAFIDEAALSTRLLTDLAVFTSGLSVKESEATMGFRSKPRTVERRLDFDTLREFFTRQPGLTSDRLKATLELALSAARAVGREGILFAYDEAQVVQDRRDKDQYPLAMFLETFQSIQRKGFRCLLLLTGLPTLFPRLVESRTYAERMFTVQEIGRLKEDACGDAILKPLERRAIKFTPESVKRIIEVSGGYPYFIQFICREFFDLVQTGTTGRDPEKVFSVPLDAIIHKLDADFFAGRWNRVPDRQRELLLCIAGLESHEEEFTITEIVEASANRASQKAIRRPFRTGDVSQMLPRLVEAGLVYKNRHGKYSFAVPLFGEYILRAARRQGTREFPTQ